MGPIYIFALVALSNNPPASGHLGNQTIGYYATVAECQTDLLKVEKTIDRSYVKLDCVPVKVSE